MTYLCMTVDVRQRITASEVITPSACNGYIADLASNTGLNALTYADANALIVAVAVLFASAAVYRLIIHFIQNRY